VNTSSSFGNSKPPLVCGDEFIHSYIHSAIPSVDTKCKGPVEVRGETFVLGIFEIVSHELFARSWL
jgi:hypothetical protein